MKSFDILRSVVRGEIDRVKDRVRESERLGALKEKIENAVRGRSLYSEKDMASAVATLSGIEAMSLEISPQHIVVHAEKDGREVSLCIEKIDARCVPRGSKELRMHVRNSDDIRSLHRDVLGGVAGAIALRTWGHPFGLRPSAGQAPPVDVHGGRVICDLRRVPDLRSIAMNTPILDLLLLGDITLLDGEIQIVSENILSQMSAHQGKD